MLPSVPLGTGSVEIAGTDVPIRSLSRSEVVSLVTFADDTTAAEAFMVSKSCGLSADDARAWLDSVDASTAGELLKAIARISGIASGEA